MKSEGTRGAGTKTSPGGRNKFPSRQRKLPVGLGVVGHRHQRTLPADQAFALIEVNASLVDWPLNGNASPTHFGILPGEKLENSEPVLSQFGLQAIPLFRIHLFEKLRNAIEHFRRLGDHEGRADPRVLEIDAQFPGSHGSRT